MALQSPTLVDLPSPPAGRVGWPWTEESPQLPEMVSDGWTFRVERDDIDTM